MPLPPSRGGMERKSTKQRHRVRRDGGSDLTDGPRRRDEKRCSGATGHRRGCRHWHLRRSSSTCDERFDDERVVEGSAASRLLWWAPMSITATPSTLGCLEAPIAARLVWFQTRKFIVHTKTVECHCSVAQRKRVGLITQRSEDRNLVEQAYISFMYFWIRM